jgi:hypothetical protein
LLDHLQYCQVVISISRYFEFASRRGSNGERDSHVVGFSLGIARDGVDDAGIVCQQPR